MLEERFRFIGEWNSEDWSMAEAAINLYRKRGYQECDRYNDNPQATISKSVNDPAEIPAVIENRERPHLGPNMSIYFFALATIVSNVAMVETRVP